MAERDHPFMTSTLTGVQPKVDACGQGEGVEAIRTSTIKINKRKILQYFAGSTTTIPGTFVS